MQSYKGREVKENMRIDVYKNLNQGGFSIRCSKSGLVLAHADSVLISDCTFHVNQKGRESVLQKKRKNVHAFVRGYFVMTDIEQPKDCDKVIYYNPYLTSSFINPETNLIPVKAKEIFVSGKLAYGSIDEDDWLNNEEGLFAFAN